jgi:hypothetical protein
MFRRLIINTSCGHVLYLADGADANISAAAPRIPEHMPVRVIWHQP